MKIIIDGETFEYDGRRMPMSDALAIEKAWGRRYAEWEMELNAGSAEAACVLVWLVWRRDGREVELQDILDGKIDFSYAEMLRSLAEAHAQAQAEKENPTTGAAPRTDPAGTPATPSGTKPSSPKSST